MVGTCSAPKGIAVHVWEPYLHGVGHVVVGRVIDAGEQVLAELQGPRTRSQTMRALPPRCCGPPAPGLGAALLASLAPSQSVLKALRSPHPRSRRLLCDSGVPSTVI